MGRVVRSLQLASQCAGKPFPFLFPNPSTACQRTQTTRPPCKPLRNLQKKKKKSKGFQVSYPKVYYNPPQYGVANVKVAAKKKKGAGKKKAKK